MLATALWVLEREHRKRGRKLFCDLFIFALLSFIAHSGG
jgi:hypothetical protein